MARPPKEIDWDLLDIYLKSGCTQKEIAESFLIHPETLGKKIKEKFDVDYTSYSRALCRSGEMLLKAAQFQKALKSSSPGNSQMLMWLGKVRLGQREPDSVPMVAPNQESIDQSH